ncbi:MAG: transport permease protein [Saprospiraceae bacterium]|nr:MAG: transport permease protein [Saprospiraceae bacterium]
MKPFLAFVKKEIYHILRDRRTLLILFGMPIIQVLIFGYAVTNEFRGASIAVLDQAQDELSTDLQRHLVASGHFAIIEQVDNVSDIESAFQKGKIKMAVVIPPDFSQDFYHRKKAVVQVLSDGSDPNTASTLLNYVTNMVNQFQVRKSQAPPLPLQINIESRLVYNPELKSVYMFVPGVTALILMLVSAMMTALTLAKEKELGTMELLLVSPLHPFLIIVGKVTPYVFLALINAIFILALGVFVFGVPIKGSLLLLLGLCLLFILTALALGILISTKTDTQQAAMLTSLMMLMMPTMLLSGFIFPVESMPRLLQWISTIIPAKYFIILLKDVMLKGSGIELILWEVMVLGIMTLFFLVVSLKNFKIRLA